MMDCTSWYIPTEYHNTDNEYFPRPSVNYPLDYKNTVRLSDFDQSIKWTGDPQEIKNDLEVMSTVQFTFSSFCSIIGSLP